MENPIKSKPLSFVSKQTWCVTGFWSGQRGNCENAAALRGGAARSAPPLANSGERSVPSMFGGAGKPASAATYQRHSQYIQQNDSIERNGCKY